MNSAESRPVQDGHERDPDAEVPSPVSSLGRQVGRGAAWALGANLIMRFASIAVTALLARILSKDDFGVFAVALAVYLVVASLAELGMASAVARSVSEPEDIAPTVASLSIVVGFGTGLAMAGGAPLLANALGQPDAAGPLRILAICVGLTGLFAVPGAQLVREFRQDRIFLATVVGFVVSNPILVLLAVHHSGAEAFAWSRVIGQLAGGAVFWFSTSRRYWPGWRSEQVRPLLAFGLPLSVANLVNWTLLNADYLILGRLLTAADVGVYMIAFNVASWATALLGSVLNSIVVPALGRLGDDPPRLRRAIADACRLVGMVALPIGAMSIGLAGPIILTLFGQKWADAVPVLSVLALYGAMYSLSLLLANVLVATGQTLRLLLIQAGVGPRPRAHHGARAPGLGTHRSGVGARRDDRAGGHPRLPGRRRQGDGCTVRDMVGAALSSSAAAPLAGAAAWAASQFTGPPWVRLVVGGLVGGLVFVAVAGRRLAALLPDRLLPSWLPARWVPERHPGTPA